ncbi:hypothetical protein AAV94_02730 [Lampropedia cohaerens]|uniref:Putative glucose-6-phosphate 1-epimerase n=1 Tax=Lampropedia cohaerens TaxID=1610491 RepID=A0A0U1Q2R2_9BURK|nr:hypothetical protein AAV94_02730 [Lampropedia cohaerens]
MHAHLLHGLPALTLVGPAGDRATVLMHGGQLVSWRTGDGAEHLYLSSRAQLDGQNAVRGGVPVCFPQFSQRGPLMHHGFARNLPWRLKAHVLADSQQLVLQLADGPVSRAFWPHAFDLELTVQLAPDQLRMALQVENVDTASWSFTAALHTYLAVDDIFQARLCGLRGARFWDAVSNVHGQAQAEPLVSTHIDCVYQSGGQPLVLANSHAAHPHRQLAIEQSSSCPQTVVWNPGPDRAADDLPPEGWQRMLCVEAACVDQAVVLAPGECWEGWQTLHWQRAGNGAAA